MGESWVKTLDDMYKTVKKGSTVLLRPDLNSPVDKNGIVQMNRRLVAHAETIHELADYGYKVVVVAHQGRCGDEDYMSLRQHSKILSGILKERYGYGFGVNFYDELLSDGAVDRIKGLDCGRILLLENTRFYGEEIGLKDRDVSQQAKSILVKTLSDVGDCLVFDGYAVAHRSSPSTTGFVDKFGDKGLVYCGRVMQREIEAIGKIRNNPDDSLFCALGGAKPEDSFNVAKNLLEKHDDIKIAFGGVILNIVLKAQGHYIGKSMGYGKKYEKYVWGAKDLLKYYGNKIILPDTVAIKQGGGRKEVNVGDVKNTDMILDASIPYIDSLSGVIKDSKTIIVNGPFGSYEKHGFADGTNMLLKIIADSDAYSVIAGGHTIKAVDNLGLSKNFGHPSTGGGATIWDLSEKDLPVIKLMKLVNKKYNV